MTMSLQDFVPTPGFEEYRETFRDFYLMERREDGVLLVAAHTEGGPVRLSVQNHRSLGQMLKTVGADPHNEVLILTGSGDEFMMASDPEGFALEEADMEYWAYEYAYKDGRINVSALVNDLEIPTIGLLNGPGFHSEIVLMCDITLAAEGATIFDLHYDIGSVPADGIHNAFQELLGVKRAAYALLTGQAITAEQALEWGMVNEVVPREALIGRAYQIDDFAARTLKQTRSRVDVGARGRLPEREAGAAEGLRRGPLLAGAFGQPADPVLPPGSLVAFGCLEPVIGRGRDLRVDEIPETAVRR